MNLQTLQCRIIIPMKNYILILLICFSAFNYPLFSQGLETDHPQTNSTPISTKENEEEPPKERSFPQEFDYYLHHPEKESDTFQAKFLNMLFLLGLLIAFMFLASWIIKKLMKTRMSELNTSSSIKIVESRNISHKAVLHLLDVRGKGILIAESPSGIHTITEVPLDEHLEWEEELKKEHQKK